MRKQWFAACTALGLAAGCAGQNGPAPPGGFAAGGSAGAFNHPGAVQQASWTDKLTAPFKHNPFAAGAASVKRTQLDPLSLAYKPGPATPQVYMAMAELSCRNGNADQARQLYQKALSMEPTSLDALLGAARMEDRGGQLDIAVELYQRAVTAHPQNATAMNDLALCLARRNQLADARHVLEEAIKVEPSKALYRNNIAKVLVEMNQPGEAVAQLSAVHPPAAAHYNMGVLLRQRGRMAEAANHLATALTIDPGMAPARELLAQTARPAGAPMTIAPLATGPAVAPTMLAQRPGLVPQMPWAPKPANSSQAGAVSAPTPTLPPTGAAPEGVNNPLGQPANGPVMSAPASQEPTLLPAIQ